MNNNELTFRDSMSKLDEIVNKLENNEIELEEAINLFEEGLKLVKRCDSQLNDFEKKVDELIQEYQGDE